MQVHSMCFSGNPLEVDPMCKNILCQQVLNHKKQQEIVFYSKNILMVVEAQDLVHYREKIDSHNVCNT